MTEIPSLTDQIIAAIGPSRAAEDMSSATRDALVQAASLGGMDPDLEVILCGPGDPRSYARSTSYWVAWEAGPDRWADSAAPEIYAATGKTVTAIKGVSLEFDPLQDHRG